MANNALNKGVEGSAKGGGMSLKILLVITFVLNILLRGSGHYFTMLINSLQIVLHLPIIKVIVPANVSMVFSYMIPVVMFDIFDTEWTTELVFNFDDDKQI